MMMKKLLLLIGLFISLVIISCGQKKQKEVVTDYAAPAAEVLSVPPPPPPMDANSTEGDGVVEEPISVDKTPPTIKKDEEVKSENAGGEIKVIAKKIIKDGSMSVKTNDIAASKKGIDGLIRRYNGYYDQENLDNNDAQISYDLKLRIPSENFEKLVSAIENGKDEITNKNITTRDVTSEYVDAEARLNNKRAYLTRYKELLNKAVTVKDILSLQENIRKLQEEIESKEGQLKLLDNQIAYSTLDLTLFKPKTYVYKPEEKDKFSERVKESLRNGWDSVVDFVLWGIKVWPNILLLLVVVFFVKRLINRRRKNMAN